jgi:CyaY protein
LQNGVLQIVFEEPAPTKFVVSPNAPMRQVWVSAMSRSFKLAWSPDASAFVLDGEPLDRLLDRLVRQYVSS